MRVVGGSVIALRLEVLLEPLEGGLAEGELSQGALHEGVGPALGAVVQLLEPEGDELEMEVEHSTELVALELRLFGEAVLEHRTVDRQFVAARLVGALEPEPDLVVLDFHDTFVLGVEDVCSDFVRLHLILQGDGLVRIY